MKKKNKLIVAILIWIAAAIVAVSMSSCAGGKNIKKDCQGVKHTKQKGGFYL